MANSRINDMRHLVEIQQQTLTDDGLGGETESWSTIITAYAAIWPLSASKMVEHQQLEHAITHRVRIRYTGGIKPGMRILFSGSYVYEIKSLIIPDMKYVYIDMLCEEITYD